MELGRHAAASVSATFIKPVKLEFEKVGAGVCGGRWLSQRRLH